MGLCAALFIISFSLRKFDEPLNRAYGFQTQKNPMLAAIRKTVKGGSLEEKGD